MTTKTIFFFISFLISFGTQASDPNRVIYGEDNRKDLFEVSDQPWIDRAKSTVALVSGHKLTEIENNQYEISTTIYGESYNLCQSEAFYDQQRAAFCSGSLIAEDIIMTAGHCIPSHRECEVTSFVFDFAYSQLDGRPNIQPKENVYSCKEIITSHVKPNGADFALIRLDRKVVGRTPLAIRTQQQIEVDAEVVVIGHPAGLPTKITDAGRVRSNGSDTFFVTTLDTYGGNSGSAVFNSDTGLVEGILVRGARDFINNNGCNVSNVCNENSCRGEDVTRVSEILSYLDQPKPQN